MFFRVLCTTRGVRVCVAWVRGQRDLVVGHSRFVPLNF